MSKNPHICQLDGRLYSKHKQCKACMIYVGPAHVVKTLPDGEHCASCISLLEWKEKQAQAMQTRMAI